MRIRWLNANRAYCRFKIGRGTFGDPAVLGEFASLEIGSFTSIATGVTILLGGEHHTDWVTTSILARYMGTIEERKRYFQNGAKGDVRIGSDVWIGLGATILSGVTIGHGAVIGARAVVAKDVPPYAVAVGNPARVVHYRFDGRTVERLLAVSWWDRSDEWIKEHLPLLLSDRIEEFLEKAEATA